MTRRYYCPELRSASELTLSGSEAQHALRVMRIQVGDEIEVFDGLGNAADARVESIARSELVVKIGQIQSRDGECSVCLELAIALPKPDRARELVERLTELGVRRVTPILAQRTQRPPSGSLLGKLRRAVIESCKQCGRNQLMTIDEPVSLSQFLSELSGSATKWIAHPDGESIQSALEGSLQQVSALVGPEGGWTEEEVRIATDAGFKRIGLGKRIYRIETAAVVIAARLAD